MNVIAEIHRINEAELEKGLVGTSASWHDKYAASAWVYVGNLPNNLTEGDVLCILSQCGEIEDINLVRDEGTGKSRGFAFCKYEDARSCVLAVDNLTGSKVLGRSLRVDHCEKYRLPKELLEKEEEAVATGAGHAYQDKELANGFSIAQGQDLFAKQPSSPPKEKTGSKEERREAKRKRKDDRHERRREREERHDRKEEKKREKRARRYREDTGDDDEEERSHKKKRKKRHRRHDEG